MSKKAILQMRAQEGTFLIHSEGRTNGGERFSVWLLSEGRVSNDYTVFVCQACGLKLVDRQDVRYTVVEGGGMDRAYDLADTIARSLGVPVTCQLRMGGPVKTFKA